MSELRISEDELSEIISQVSTRFPALDRSWIKNQLCRLDSSGVACLNQQPADFRKELLWLGLYRWSDEHCTSIARRVALRFCRNHGISDCRRQVIINAAIDNRQHPREIIEKFLHNLVY